MMTVRTGRGRYAGLWLCLMMAAVCLPVYAQGDDYQSFSSFEGDGQGGAPLIDTFEVTDADVRSVFKMLSRHSGVDIVLSENVSGVVTLRLTDKTWRDIFMIVCRIVDLQPAKEENYFFVMTRREFDAQMLASASTSEAEDRMAPLERHIIALSNITARDLVAPVTTILSSRGKLTTVERNNSLIVYDTKETIKQIRGMVEKLDVETPQISISCKIIEVNSGESQNLGIHWGFLNPRASLAASHLDAPTATTGGVQVVAGALEKVSYGILTPERFSIALEYLFEESRGEVVAQPSITTLANSQARIFTGQQVPVVHLDVAGNSVVTMMDAGTEMTVTPQVTSEGRIMLELNPKKKSYYFGETGQPIINEQSAQTNVVVNDGETVVIAGLTSNEMVNADAGIPFLKDIPLIGNLFKRSRKSRISKDLIIFVTPHIIHRELGGLGAGVSASDM